MTPHVVRQNFLTPEEHAGLLAWTLAKEQSFTPATLAGGVIEPGIRHSSSMRNLGPLAPVFKSRIGDDLPALIKTLRVTPFTASEIELELVAHNNGAHYALHSDINTRRKSARGDRLLSAVYYFHREPKGFSGGYLRLHKLGVRQGDGDGLDIPPEQNSLVVFPSWGPHEVRPVHCPSGAFADSRFAVNCWIYGAPGA